MGAISRFFKQFENSKFGDLLPVLDYNRKHKYFELEDSYIGLMYKIETVPAVNDELQELLEQIYKAEWPEDTFIQVIFWANDDLSPFTNNFSMYHGGRQTGDTNERLNSISKGLINHFKQSSQTGFGDSDCRARIFDCYFVVKVPMKGNFGVPTKKELKHFNNLRTDTEESLNKVGLFCTPLDQWGWLHFMQRLMNRKDSATWRKGDINKNEAYMPRDQVQEQGGKVEFTESRVLIDERPISMLTPKEYPKTLGFGDMLNVFSDWRYGHSTAWSNFMIILNVHYPNAKKEAGKVKRRRKYMTMQANNKLVNWNDTVRWQRADFDEAFTKIEQKKSRMVNAYLQFMIIGDDEEHLETEIARFKKVASTPAGFELEEDKYMTPPMFIHSLPFAPDPVTRKRLDRYNLVPSDVCAFMSPIISSSSGNSPSKPVIPFVTRDMSMFGFNPFETDGSMNGIVVAESGSGKSVLVQYIVTCILGSGKMPSRHLWSMMNLPKAEVDKLMKTAYNIAEAKRDGGMAMIIDVGRSYYRLCEALNGQFISFGQDMKFSLNPFPSIVEFSGKEGQAGMILEMLSVMAEPNGTLTTLQKRGMTTILKLMWDKHGRDSSVTIFADMCSASTRKELNDIGEQLKPFREGEMFGEMFTVNKPPPTLDNSFIVCELEELKSQPELQVIALMQIINLCYQHFFLGDAKAGSQRRSKAFIVDECWEFLKENQGSGAANPVSTFLESAFRRFRKVDASAWIITQLLSDLYGSSVGKAIAANCVYRCFLYQKSDTINQVKNDKLVALSDQEFEILKSIRTRKNRYSEIFFQIGDDIKEVVRFYAPPAMLLMYSTDPKDKMELAALMEQGYTQDQAIDKILETRRVESFATDMDDLENDDEEQVDNAA
ncbi:P-loop_TraG domain-containing protein [Vibrio chagasii]|nr:P-loop_TraG domain-containing protein [Vibrio chagasii]